MLATIFTDAAAAAAERDGCAAFYSPNCSSFCLLLKSAHGYELMERLARDADAPTADPGLVYRTLRQLEDDGLVRSSWDTEGHGPARRLYQLTPEGMEFLNTWAVNIRQTRQQLDRFLSEYETYLQEEKR